MQAHGKVIVYTSRPETQDELVGSMREAHTVVNIRSNCKFSAEVLQACPHLQHLYWIRFALGLLAGVLLAELVPTDTSHSVYHGVAKPTLALLGGFSASVVYRLL